MILNKVEFTHRGTSFTMSLDDTPTITIKHKRMVIAKILLWERAGGSLLAFKAINSFTNGKPNNEEIMTYSEAEDLFCGLVRIVFGVKTLVDDGTIKS